MATDRLLIETVHVTLIDVPLTDEFVISRGRMTAANNAVVRIVLADGSFGLGEVAPFPAVTGENRSESVDAVNEFGALILGKNASSYRDLSNLMREHRPRQLAARAAVECALLDAMCRSAEVPLWKFWGGAEARSFVTDITLPILAEDRIDELAWHWHGAGFRTFKIKVGEDIDRDVNRVLRLSSMFPDVSFVLDANQGFDSESARAFVQGLGAAAARVDLLEQPLPRDQVEATAALRRDLGVMIAADESVMTAEDAGHVIRMGAADVINLKLTKSGLLEAIAILELARAHGLGVMVGGMVETRLAMSFSLAMAAGFGGVKYFDLDTPLLMSHDPFTGGYTYDGPVMTLTDEPGTGIRFVPGR